MSGRAGVYGVLALIGLVAPVVGFVAFVKAFGLDLDLLAAEATGSITACVLLADLMIASITFWVWISGEGPRLGLRWWPYVILNLIVGLCFALPLFMFKRERALQARG
ncbi:MAG: DUF2834 domain-containing protein [Thermoleophilaceae bacterium]|nr:DUF2834 domain-containing protein [Thermoleophilaceae bacterium]